MLVTRCFRRRISIETQFHNLFMESEINIELLFLKNMWSKFIKKLKISLGDRATIDAAPKY